MWLPKNRHNVTKAHTRIKACETDSTQRVIGGKREPNVAARELDKTVGDGIGVVPALNGTGSTGANVASGEGGVK